MTADDHTQPEVGRLMLFGQRTEAGELGAATLLLDTPFLGYGIEHVCEFEVETRIIGVLCVNGDGSTLVDRAWEGDGYVPANQKISFTVPTADWQPPQPWPPAGAAVGRKVSPSDPGHWQHHLPKNFAGLPVLPSTPEVQRALHAMRSGDISVMGFMIPNVWQYIDDYARYGIDLATAILSPDDPVSREVIEIAKAIWRIVYEGVFTAVLFGQVDPAVFPVLLFFIALLSSWFARESEH